MNAIVLLTLRPNKAQADFFREVAGKGLYLFILVDDNGFDRGGFAGHDLIQVDDGICRASGFHDFNPVIRKPSGCSAWDKSLYYFSCIDTRYDHIWFVEEDVFVTSADVIPEVDRKYAHADIVSASNSINTTGELGSWYWWKNVPRQVFPLPWAKSMVCAVRLSARLLRSLRRLVQTEAAALRSGGCFPFIEFVFHTLALQEGMRVVQAEELRGIVWRQAWKLDDFRRNGLYHPVKDVSRHAILRACLGMSRLGCQGFSRFPFQVY